MQDEGRNNFSSTKRESRGRIRYCLETSRIPLKFRQYRIRVHVRIHGTASRKNKKWISNDTVEGRKKNNTEIEVSVVGGTRETGCVYFSAKPRQTGVTPTFSDEDIGKVRVRGWGREREREGFERELGRGRKKNSMGKTAQTEDERTEKRTGRKSQRCQRNISSYLNLHERAEQRGFSIHSLPLCSSLFFFFQYFYPVFPARFHSSPPFSLLLFHSERILRKSHLERRESWARNEPNCTLMWRTVMFHANAISLP